MYPSKDRFNLKKINTYISSTYTITARIKMVKANQKPV